MRSVILAAGYGTRLERDLRDDKSGNYKHLIGIPKPLLPVGGIPLATHWVKCFNTVPNISSLVVVVNDLHKPLYEQWRETLTQDIDIVNDGSRSNESRSGAVACMALGVQEYPYDTLFVAGDTLLKQDFSLATMIAKFESVKKQDGRACLVLGCPVSEENVSKHGIIEVDDDGRVKRLLEKPQPHETTSRLQCPCVYLISAPSLPLIQPTCIQSVGVSTVEVVACKRTAGLVEFWPSIQAGEYLTRFVYSIPSHLTASHPISSPVKQNSIIRKSSINEITTCPELMSPNL